MANSLESQAEEDEKKKMEYSSSAPNKSRHVNSASKNHNTPWNSDFTLSEIKVLKYGIQFNSIQFYYSHIIYSQVGIQ